MKKDYWTLITLHMNIPDKTDHEMTVQVPGAVCSSVGRLNNPKSYEQILIKLGWGGIHHNPRKN